MTDSIPPAPTRFRGWHAAAFGLALVGVYLLLNATRLPFSILTLREHAGGHTILNLLPYYDAATAYEHLASYSPQAVAVYHAILALDVVVLIPVYVLAFSSALALAGARVLMRTPRPRERLYRGLLLMPALAGAMNLLEDGLILFLLQTHPARYGALSGFAGVVTTTKTVLISASALAAAALWTAIAASRVAHRAAWRSCHV